MPETNDPTRPDSPSLADDRGGDGRGFSRRKLLALGAAPLAVSAAAPVQGAEVLSPRWDAEFPGSSPEYVQRRIQAFEVRRHAAVQEAKLPFVTQQSNNDEELYPGKIGNFTKGLPHNSRGEVNLDAYQRLKDALDSKTSEAFEHIPLGCPDPSRQRKLVNPQAALCFDLQGTDSHQLAIPPAPAFASAEAAGEMVELYWQALLRDVSFIEYASTPLVHEAAAELSRLSDFRGPKMNGSVTPQTLFRGSTPGDLVGQYVSQFLLKPIPFGVQYVEQRMRCLRPGLEYGTTYQEWLDLLNGCAPLKQDEFLAERRYPISGRDLAEWVHRDVLYQAYFNAALILSTPSDPKDEVTGGGIGAPFDPSNPYLSSLTQDAFGTFGTPHLMALLAEVSTRALKAVWFQKWKVHRRLRPEEYGGRVHQTLGLPGFHHPLSSDVPQSLAVEYTRLRFGSHLLPLAYPEGSPVHPAYGAGHATVAGACVTILKAFFDETFVIPNPVMPSGNGLNLIPYRGADRSQITVGGELNKLAANISIARNFAGIHWRTDYTASARLGEAVAVSVLRDQKLTYNEAAPTFRFTNFDGSPVEI